MGQLLPLVWKPHGDMVGSSLTACSMSPNLCRLDEAEEDESEEE